MFTGVATDQDRVLWRSFNGPQQPHFEINIIQLSELTCINQRSPDTNRDQEYDSQVRRHGCARSQAAEDENTS